MPCLHKHNVWHCISFVLLVFRIASTSGCNDNFEIWWSRSPLDRLRRRCIQFLVKLYSASRTVNTIDAFDLSRRPFYGNGLLLINFRASSKCCCLIIADDLWQRHSCVAMMCCWDIYGCNLSPHFGLWTNIWCSPECENYSCVCHMCFLSSMLGWFISSGERNCFLSRMARKFDSLLGMFGRIIRFGENIYEIWRAFGFCLAKRCPCIETDRVIGDTYAFRSGARRFIVDQTVIGEAFQVDDRWSLKIISYDGVRR